MQDLKGKTAWLLNPEFSRAVVSMSGLKYKPEREDRGIELWVIGYWDGSKMSPNHAIQLQRSSVAIRLVPGTTRYLKLVLERLSGELTGYRLPEVTVGVESFVSRCDRRFYVKGLKPLPEDKPFSVPPYELRTLPIHAGSVEDLEKLMQYELKSIRNDLRILHGWGWN